MCKIIHNENHNPQTTATLLPHPCLPNSFPIYCPGPSCLSCWKDLTVKYKVAEFREKSSGLSIDINALWSHYMLLPD